MLHWIGLLYFLMDSNIVLDYIFLIFVDYLTEDNIDEAILSFSKLVVKQIDRSKSTSTWADCSSEIFCYNS